MAYVDQSKKAKIAPVIKALLKEYGLKGSLSVRNHSTLVLTVKEGTIDFIGDYNTMGDQNDSMGRFQPATTYLGINPYWIDRNHSGKAAEFLSKAVTALRGEDFFDESDIQSDYFHCAHYVDIKIGQWDKPYILTKQTEPA